MKKTSHSLIKIKARKVSLKAKMTIKKVLMLYSLLKIDQLT